MITNMLAFTVTYVTLHTVCFPLVAQSLESLVTEPNVTLVSGVLVVILFTGLAMSRDLGSKCQAQVIHVSHKTITKGDDQSLGITKKTRIL